MLMQRMKVPQKFHFLQNEIPLSKFNLNVISISPDVNIQSADFGESGIPLSAEITATYKQVPLKDLKVDWKVDGAKFRVWIL